MQQKEEEHVEEVRAEALLAKYKQEASNVFAPWITVKVAIEGQIVSHVRRRMWMTLLCKKK